MEKSIIQICILVLSAIVASATASISLTAALTVVIKAVVRERRISFEVKTRSEYEIREVRDGN